MMKHSEEAFNVPRKEGMNAAAEEVLSAASMIAVPSRQGVVHFIRIFAADRLSFFLLTTLQTCVQHRIINCNINIIFLKWFSFLPQKIVLPMNGKKIFKIFQDMVLTRVPHVTKNRDEYRTI